MTGQTGLWITRQPVDNPGSSLWKTLGIRATRNRVTGVCGDPLRGSVVTPERGSYMTPLLPVLTTNHYQLLTFRAPSHLPRARQSPVENYSQHRHDNHPTGGA